MKPANSIFTIQPYLSGGCWVFDDASTGLVREPFVAGIDVMIDLLVADIPNAASGFNLRFAAIPFPGHSVQLDFIRAGEQGIGNYYKLVQPPMVNIDDEPGQPFEGWLCPALLLYFQNPPQKIYAQCLPGRK